MFSDIYLQSRANELGTSFENIAKESLQLQLLEKLSTSPLGDILVFKGGTALHFILNSRRFSEDLDFSVLHPIDDPQKYLTQLIELCRAGGEIKDQQVKFNTILIQLSHRWQNFPYSLSIKIEISTREILTASQVELSVLQSVLDFPLISFQAEKKEVLMADKITACLSRGKARDLYDLLFLLSRKITPDLRRIIDLTNKNWRSIGEVWEIVSLKINSLSQQDINTDLTPFLDKTERRLLPTLKENLIKLIAQQ